MKKGSRTYERGQLQPQRYIPQTQEAEEKIAQDEPGHIRSHYLSALFLSFFLPRRLNSACFRPLPAPAWKATTLRPPPLFPQKRRRLLLRAVTMDTLYSPCAILEELGFRRHTCILQCIGNCIYPASLTKIMTALLAIENTPDLDQPIRLTEELFSELYFRHASVAGFQPASP